MRCEKSFRNTTGKHGGLLAVGAIGALLAGWTVYVGYRWGVGPCQNLHDVKMAKLPGNDRRYAPENQGEKNKNLLNGKTVVFLGSSVTYGASSKRASFADYIGVRNDCRIVKEAVSGTTLVDNGASSYVRRLKKIKEKQADLFVCQLSTNDASQKKPLGEITDSRNIKDFDTKTVAGAIEYIIAYAKETWNCPVMFYTNPRYDSSAYSEMVELLLKVQKKWDVGVMDLWSDPAFNEISDQERSLYMDDAIHPTQAGYLLWWTPKMEEEMVAFLARREKGEEELA